MMRPFLVQAKNKWDWTGNVGGASFLVYNNTGNVVGLTMSSADCGLITNTQDRILPTSFMPGSPEIKRSPLISLRSWVEPMT